MQRDKTERRRRNSEALKGQRKRLHVDEKLLDREKYTYRWVNDTPGRIHNFTVEDDWDIVTERGESSDSMGSGVEKMAGTGDGGSAIQAVLLRKPKDYHDADRAEAQTIIDEREKSMTQSATSDHAPVEGSYKPRQGGGKISRD